MGFVALDNFQTVSCNNLQDGVTIGYFTLKSTIPASQKQITKTEANDYVFIDTSITSYASKASNQLVVKSDLVATFSYNGNFYIRDIISSVTEGFSSSSVACSDYLGTGLTPGTAYWNGPLTTGTLVFLTIPSFAPLDVNDYFIIVYSGTAYWVKFNALSFNIDYGFKGIFYAAHTIQSIGTCITYTDGYSTSSASDACLAGIPMTGISYIGGGSLCSATQMQTNEFILEIAGSTLWVSVGGQVREATVDSPNVSGIVTFVTSCTAC
jgi:hypothetical protein